MFETYVVESKRTLPRWAKAIIVVSAVLHVGAGSGLLIWSWLRVDKIETPDRKSVV